MDLKYYFRKVKDLHVNDVFAFIPMMAALIVSPLFKKKYREVWGICERPNEACDNGYHFFKYMCKTHPEQRCIYAIDPDCRDYVKVSKLGETVRFGSVRHWILYFTCEYLISSQSFKPNGYMATLFERMGVFNPAHVFLQHGITKDVAEFLLASHRKVKYFLAGAKPEFEFMKQNFGYPDGTMHYTGFARFDALHSFEKTKGRILIMPTWRKWLKLKSEAHDDTSTDVGTSVYLQNWKRLLSSDRLSESIDKGNLDVVFFLHPNMREIIDPKDFVGERIRIADPIKDDLQELMKTAELLITDYSSVFFDMVYMKKPVIFYQFDEKTYRKYHYQQGWFDYHKTSFGKFCDNDSKVLDELVRLIGNGFTVTEEYLDEHKRVFPLYDGENCRRIYELLR